MKAFEGAGKAKKLHLTESVFFLHRFIYSLLSCTLFILSSPSSLSLFHDQLHFPSVYNHHWFLFTVDIRDKKFMFMDSMFAKDSSFHREVDERMVQLAITSLTLCCCQYSTSLPIFICLFIFISLADEKFPINVG
jgi:hypothetical protein